MSPPTASVLVTAVVIVPYSHSTVHQYSVRASIGSQEVCAGTDTEMLDFSRVKAQVRLHRCVWCRCRGYEKRGNEVHRVLPSAGDGRRCTLSYVEKPTKKALPVITMIGQEQRTAELLCGNTTVCQVTHTHTRIGGRELHSTVLQSTACRGKPCYQGGETSPSNTVAGVC